MLLSHEHRKVPAPTTLHMQGTYTLIKSAEHGKEHPRWVQVLTFWF